MVSQQFNTLNCQRSKNLLEKVETRRKKALNILSNVKKYTLRSTRHFLETISIRGSYLLMDMAQTGREFMIL